MKGTKGKFKAGEEFATGTAMRTDVLQLYFNVVNKDKLQDSHKQMAGKNTHSPDSKAEANLFSSSHPVSSFWLLGAWGFFQERDKSGNRI